MITEAKILRQLKEIDGNVERMLAEAAAKDALIDRLRLEAQGHAMEASSANATIYAIYQAVTGAKGEPGNWNGAQPVIEALATKDATIAAMEDENARLRAALASAAMRLKAVHDDAFKQAGGHGLKTTDGRDFSCTELNLCNQEATHARAALEASKP